MTTSLRCGSGLLVACLLTSAQAAEYSPDQFLFGDWNGAAFADLDRQPEWRRWNTDRDHARAPSGQDRQNP